MKLTGQTLRALVLSALFILSCSKDDNTVAIVDPIQKEDPKDPDKPDDPDTPTTGQFQMVDVQVILPQESEVAPETTTVFSLASPSTVSGSAIGNLPFNPGTAQLAYLMDSDNNLLLAGFLTDNRKEISIATTAEVMLYFGLGYQLLNDGVKLPYIEAIRQVSGFSNFVSEIESLFANNPIMYTEGAYESVLNAKIDEIITKETIDISARIEVDSRDTRSGITVTDIDASNIQVQNSYPRRTHTFVYKKASTDEDGNETQIENYTANPLTDFEIKAGGRDAGAPTISEGGVSSFSQCNVGLTNIENTTSQNIELPVADNELSAEYEVVVVGPGTGQGTNGRDFTPTERAKFEELSKETYILDNFLPTLLDIGGNKGLLPAVGDAKEEQLVNAVLPFLEANPNVLAQVLKNDFDAASKDFIPFLYDDIRQSNDLREILKNVYDIVDGGNSPNTFIQSQELIEDGEARYKALLGIIDRNINSNDNKCNNYRIDDSANLESWIVKSSQGKVKVGPECLNIMFNEVGDIEVQANVDIESGQTLEYDWSTPGNFGGRIQDINGDSGNFGTSITTSEATVSFSSVALESDLSNGDNIENVTVTAYVKNTDGSRSEVGSDQMKVNIKRQGFYVTPAKACIEGGKNVALRIKHNDGQITIPNNETDYKLVWHTSGKYGQLSGRNTAETTYNDDLIFYQSQDLDVERGVDQVSVSIYGRSKGSNESYGLLDTVEVTVTTKNDPDCDITLRPLMAEDLYPSTSNNCPEGENQSYKGEIVVYVPIKDDATSYQVDWTEMFIAAQNFSFNGLPSVSWTNENHGNISTVTVEGGNYRVVSPIGNGAACKSNPNVGDLIAYLNGISGFGTATICYD